eukprot:508843_1
MRVIIGISTTNVIVVRQCDKKDWNNAIDKGIDLVMAEIGEIGTMDRGNAICVVEICVTRSGSTHPHRYLPLFHHYHCLDVVGMQHSFSLHHLLQRCRCCVDVGVDVDLPIRLHCL